MVDPVVELQSGLVRGVVERHEEGFDYYAFRGIPYAEPPVGELRFQEPVPIKKWEGTIECVNFGPMCLQYDPITKVTSDNEDCLHLNVFTRTINNPDVRRPVMVVVHGGAFVFGSSHDFLYGPDYLIRKNVVMVTANYRLGVLGFLNLEDKVAPGNQGLKDFLMVLQWVQQHARALGADPMNVTLFGVGSGGAVAHALALSPQTKGLIHKVISQGSSLFNSWTCLTNMKSNAMKLCSLLGRELTDSREILEFLKTVEAKRLQEAQQKLWLALETLPFCPGVDDKSANPLMPIHQYTAACQAVQLPLLLGCCDRDGTALLMDEICHPGVSNEEFFAMCDEDFRQCCRYSVSDIAERYDLTIEQVRRLYYGGKRLSMENQDRYADYASDVYYVEGIHRWARVQSEGSCATTYLYKFSFEAKVSLFKQLLKNPPAGATHYDDLPFLFKMRAVEAMGNDHFKKGSREYTLMEQMTEMYANFAEHGRPTIDTSDLIPVHWKPIADGTLLRYLNMDEDFTMQVTVNVDQKFLSARDIKV